MKDETLTKIFIGMIAIGVVLIIYSKRESLFGAANTPTAQQQNFAEEMEKINNIKSSLDLSSKKMPTNIKEAKKVEKKPHRLTPEEAAQKKSEEVKKTYTEIARVKMNLPEHLKFISLDIEDGAEVIYGYDHLNNLGLTVMAIPQMVKNEDVLPYLDQSQSFLPDTKNNPVTSIGKPTPLPQPKESTNLKGGSLWSGALKDGKQVHIVKLEREDEKGSYFFMYTGPQSYFNNNDDYFQNLYDSFEALPADQ